MRKKKQTEEPDYRRLFDTIITGNFRHALRIIVTDPALFRTGTDIARMQRRAAEIRKKREKQGLIVPPVMIVSITRRCNLSCRGCYMHEQRNVPVPDMSPDLLRTVVSDAVELGVSVVVIAGGEPLLRKDEIFSLASSFPPVLFPLFTNGLMIDEGCAAELVARKNIVPLISCEGFQAETDSRRGAGMYHNVLSSCTILKKNKVFFGCSLTVSRVNLDLVTDEQFITAMMEAGARVFTFVEYVPIHPGTENLVLTHDQQQQLQIRLLALEKEFPALFIGFPGDEKRFGGCLAAGRGFIHISASGDVEPCPAAPFSDANLATIPLQEALQSRFLDEIRNHHDKLTETNGGCALWTNREWVQHLIME